MLGDTLSLNDTISVHVTRKIAATDTLSLVDFINVGAQDTDVELHRQFIFYREEVEEQVKEYVKQVFKHKEVQAVFIEVKDTTIEQQLRQTTFTEDPVKTTYKRR